MSEAAICGRLEISPQRTPAHDTGKVRFFNHAMGQPAALKHIGHDPRGGYQSNLTGGFSRWMSRSNVNALIFDYDQLIIIGPVFPHEVVGFSGGNKYLFPGVGGPEILNFFHWLGAVVTNPMIIGNKWTPVRKVVDRAGAMVTPTSSASAMVVDARNIWPAFLPGTPGSRLGPGGRNSPASSHHLQTESRFIPSFPARPAMYDELWIAGKCMYKLEPVRRRWRRTHHLRARTSSEICVTTASVIRQIGYHCRDYFLKQWDKFKDLPWGMLAHSTHVRGIGRFRKRDRAVPRQQLLWPPEFRRTFVTKSDLPTAIPRYSRR